MRRLGGPTCSFVGHPLTEQVGRFRPSPEEQRRRDEPPPLVLVLPGSRSGEVARMAPVFGEAMARVAAAAGPLEIVVPAVPRLAKRVEAAIAAWPVKARIVVEAGEKDACFRNARAALAKSGTSTLELALAGIPMVAAYKVSLVEEMIARLFVTAPSAILANLVLGENVVPEFLQRDCTAETLSVALLPLLRDTPERGRQTQAFARLDEIMQVGKALPSTRAAELVLSSTARKTAA